MLLNNNAVVKLSHELGLTVAIANSDGHILGHLMANYSADPSADLLAVKGRDGWEVKALTPNGEAFLALM